MWSDKTVHKQFLHLAVFKELSLLNSEMQQDKITFPLCMNGENGRTHSPEKLWLNSNAGNATKLGKRSADLELGWMGQKEQDLPHVD